MTNMKKWDIVFWSNKSRLEAEESCRKYIYKEPFNEKKPNEGHIVVPMDREEQYEKDNNDVSCNEFISYVVPILNDN